MEIQNDPRLLLLSPRDNVFVAIRTIEPGEALLVAGRECLLEKRITLGHKIAARDIPAGEKIIKYGVSIGSATSDIAAGGHVHIHNMQSDYLHTYTYDEGNKYVAGH